MRLLIVALLGLTVAHVSAPTAGAQTSVTPVDFVAAGPPPAGWSFTPALDYAFVWDSNVLIQNAVSDELGEQVHVLKPRGSATFDGRRGKFGAHYTGAFIQYPTLNSLNSFDQRVDVDGTRLLTRRQSIFANYGAAASPTTALVELAGVPFARVGTRRQDLHAGVTSRLSRKTELTAGYRFEWVKFDEDPTRTTFLNLAGGHSHGGTVGLRYGVSERLSITGDYDMQHATIVDGDTFMLQNSWAGADYQLSENVRVFGSAGMSYLGAVDGRPSRRGPSLRVGITRSFEAFSVGVSYNRSFVPSYGFGGTTDNEELNAHVQLPLTRRVFVRSALSLRQNEPLETESLKLGSQWYHASVGYLLTNWARIEGFTASQRQNIDRPGGLVNRYTLGVQITAATTARMR